MRIYQRCLVRGLLSVALAHVLAPKASPLAAMASVVTQGAARQSGSSHSEVDEQSASASFAAVVSNTTAAVERRRTEELGSEAPRFVASGEAAVLSQQEVLLGVIVIEGHMMMQLVAEIAVTVQRSLSELVVVPMSYVVISVSGEFTTGASRTLYGPEMTVTFRYILLPPKGQADETALEILQSGAQPNPPFLQTLAWHMRQNDQLEWMSAGIDEWRVEIRMPTKSSLKVWCPPDYEPSLTTQPPAQEKLTPAPGPGTPASDSECRQAKHPCSCAALAACAWVSDSSGISTCVAGSQSSIGEVTCSACPAQDHCPDASCARVRDPCYCAASNDNCQWDEAGGSCRKGSGGRTSCIVCASQSHCTPPRIVSFYPPSGSTLNSVIGSRIRVAFDRSLRFLPSPGSVELRCHGEALPVGVPFGQLKLEVNVLIVDVTSITQTYNGNAIRRCSLMVGDRIVSGTDRVPFLGMKDGEYLLLFGDSVAPKVLDFNPPNGKTDVAPSTVVTFTFNEPIVFGPAAAGMSAKLSRLEAGERVSAVEDLPLLPPLVAVDATRLKVDLTGKAEAGFHYSLSLPSGAVADLSQNEFGGLPTRAYAFRTAPIALRGGYTSSERNQGMSPTTLKIILAGGGAVLLALFLVVVWRLCRLRQMKKAYLQRASEVRRLNTVRPSQESSSDRPSMLRHSSTASMNSSPKAPVTPGGPVTPGSQVPLDAFEDSLKSDHEFFKRTDTWAPGRSSSTRQSRSSDRSVHSASEAARKQWAQQVQATRKWHQAFAKAAAARKGSDAFKSAGAEQHRGSRHSTRAPSPAQKERPGQNKPPGRSSWSPGDSPKSSSHGSTSTEGGRCFPGEADKKSGAASGSSATAGSATGGSRRSPTFGAGSTANGTGGQPNDSAHRSSQEGDGHHRHSSKNSSQTEGDGHHRHSSKNGSANSSQTEGDGHHRHSSKNGSANRPSMESAGFSPEDPEPLRQQKREVEKRLRALMDSPIAERKKALRELMLEYHPDKNSDQYAKDVFQFINANRGWFLSET